MYVNVPTTGQTAVAVAVAATAAAETITIVKPQTQPQQATIGNHQHWRAADRGGVRGQRSR